MILQESIRILGQFIRKDKLVHVSTLKCHLEAKHECTSPANSKIQTQILLDLQKVCFSLLNFIEMHSSTISNLISFTKLLKLFFFFVLFAEREKIEEDNKEKKSMLKNCKEDLEDDPNDDELCFLTMVDLKLVSRMLNMRRITRNQLSWCHHKLSCITFPNGKIKLQPSSFPFLSHKFCYVFLISIYKTRLVSLSSCHFCLNCIWVL